MTGNISGNISASFFSPALHIVLHIVLLALLAPLVSGIITSIRIRANGGGSGGGWLSPAAPYTWLRATMKHGIVIPAQATSLFMVLPCVSLVATALAAFLTPSFLIDGPVTGEGDAILILGLLSLSLIARIMGSMDTGLSQNSIGTLRQGGEVLWMELIVTLSLSALTMLGGNPVLTALHTTGMISGGTLLISLLLPGLCLAALAGAGMLRTPSEDMPHLSGPLLAMASYERSLRLLTWISVMAIVFLPFDMISLQAGLLHWGFAILTWGGKILFLAALLGLAQALLPFPAAGRGAAFLLLGSVFTLLAVLCLLAGQYPA
ncbi:Formate hydrogenlyase subunit 4 [Granulibacter bethesdensis]|uniref:NADH-quinone oxidoreductase subunit H n=1 Tax=Granulibacter bethesdensis TaxID=364410 RepID=UPI00090AB632|nr:NADH-quinone oxidoreductase subunit H [Granulibacter bethesdensis]APH58227.1 Formate hydrogenlyase subunit 4 [Granulibacter bethesdensis]